MAEYGIPYEIDTPAGTLSFNPANSVDGMYLTDVSGLDAPALRTNVDNRPQLDGGIVYDSYDGPRYPVLTGYLRYLTVALSASNGRRAAEDTLRSYLYSIRRADGTLRFTPRGASERELKVRLEGLQISSQEGPLQTFQIALVAGDARVMDSASQSANSTNLSGGGATKWLFPFSFPFTFGAATGGGQAVVTNSGNIDAYPIFTITGACTAPLIFNTASGLEISLPNLVLGDADTCVIDTYNQTITVNGSEGIQYLDVSASTFFTLAAASSTTLRLFANSFDAGANLQVTFSNAWA